MKDIFANDTIAAVSTPVGKSGIGIVRLSGKDALGIADKIFIPANGGRCPSQLSSYSIRYGWIVENSKSKNQKSKIDEVLLTVMRSPKTYTREDIVEINCHSGIVILKRILDLVLREGARLAQRGEFTKRAFLNGRIDLAQAEAVLDIINSQTQQALTAALGQLQGRLSKKIKVLRQQLLEILTAIEAAIDFCDQDIDIIAEGALAQKLQDIIQNISQLIASAEQGAILREGIACVICGKPNVGKSSLLNALLKKERAIVTAVAGTTRDSLEETIDLFGIPLRLIDTAGIVTGRNVVEKEAVARTRRHLQEANFVLFVLDASRRLAAEDLKIAKYIAAKPALVVLNKEDLSQKLNGGELRRIARGRTVLRVSALYGKGLDRLERELAKHIWQGKTTADSEILVTNIRHQEILKRVRVFLQRASSAQTHGQGAEIIALEIKEAQRALGEIIGEISCEEVLDRIFSQYCIGK